MRAEPRTWLIIFSVAGSIGFRLKAASRHRRAPLSDVCTVKKEGVPAMLLAETLARLAPALNVWRPPKITQQKRRLKL
jgi:hypothetical protein